MGIPHQAFNCKRIMFYVIFLYLGLTEFVLAKDYDSLFIVENVKVDVTAQNSVTAQNKAFERAQQQAFQILAKRMVEEEQVASVATPSALTIASLIKDYEVTDEQLSAVQYVGTYIFRFRAAAVSKFFSVSGVKYTDKSSNPLLVLPVFQKNGQNTLWSEGNIWMQAWGRAQINSGLVPVGVPIGDLMDMADIDEDRALRYERRRLDRMLARYNAKEAAIMIAVPDTVLSAINMSSDIAMGSLRISIYRTDRARAEHVRDISLESNGNETLGQLYDRGVLLSYSALQKDWKGRTLSSAAQSQIFHVSVPITNIKQWMQVQKLLNNLAGLSDISIISLKKAQGRISFKYRGDEQHLREELSRVNMSLGQGYPNGSVYDFTENERNAPNVIYDLTFGNKSGKVKSHGFYQGVEPAAGESENNGSHTF